MIEELEKRVKSLRGSFGRFWVSEVKDVRLHEGRENGKAFAKDTARQGIQKDYALRRAPAVVFEEHSEDED